MKSIPQTPVSLAQSIIVDSDRYELPFSNQKISLRVFRDKLNEIEADASFLSNSFEFEGKKDVEEKIAAIKNISLSKSLTETRVRFWLHLMTPVMLSMANKIMEQHNVELKK